MSMLSFDDEIEPAPSSVRPSQPPASSSAKPKQEHEQAKRPDPGYSATSHTQQQQSSPMMSASDLLDEMMGSCQVSDNKQNSSTKSDHVESMGAKMASTKANRSMSPSGTGGALAVQHGDAQGGGASKYSAPWPGDTAVAYRLV
jgi:hypothetical protein